MNINSILDNVGKVIVGKDDVVVKVLTSILAGGHILLEDVPGTGKTMLAKTVGVLTVSLKEYSLRQTFFRQI